MIPDALLDILVCPESKKALTPASGELLTQVQKAVSQGKLKNKQGNVVEHSIDGLLVCEETKIGYPISEGIPILLVEEGIDLSDREVLL